MAKAGVKRGPYRKHNGTTMRFTVMAWSAYGTCTKAHYSRFSDAEKATKAHILDGLECVLESKAMTNLPLESKAVTNIMEN